MALLDWLRKRMAGDRTARLEISKDEESLSGLNLKDALDAHMAWNERLKNELDNHPSDISVAEIAQDNLCTLGKWIYGPGKSLYAKLPEYEELRKTHARFHLCAGEIVSEHHANHSDKARQMLNGEFLNLSERLELDLVRLFTAAR